MRHVVLLGDSILDNGAYVAGGPDVAAQLRGVLPHDWRVTLLAEDGATTTDLPGQLRALPADATHLVVSVGGNDALRHTGILERRATSAAEVLDLLAGLRDAFEPAYRRALAPVQATGLPLVVCTIYHGNLPDPALARRAAVALDAFNGAILHVAVGAGLDVVDLRHVCTGPADYANPIEPSVRGGARIARALARALHLPGAGSTRVVGDAG
jgi:hypothetical protein